MDISLAAQAIIAKAEGALAELRIIHAQLEGVRGMAKHVAEHANVFQGSSLMAELTIFALACFLGYYVIWRVTPALHSPLMAVTNAISSVIIIGAIMALGAGSGGVGAILAGVAVGLASVNIFGGFLVTERMLQMFQRKPETEPKQ